MTDLERIKKDVVEMDSRANVCWYDTKVLTKAVRLILEELTADRKTENSSEKPNNCEECKHWNDTEDGCADRHGCKTTEDCSTVKPQNYCDDCLYCDTCDSKEFFYAYTSKATISKMEQVDEPQKCSVNGRPYDCGNCEYHKCTADEPQTELVNDSSILVKDLVDDEFNPYDEECMRCKHLKLKCEFIPTYCKFESRNEPQTERSE